MKKTKRPEPFDWSRYPSREGIYKVFLGDPEAYTTFGKGISKEELANSLAVYNKIVYLEQKKKFFRDTLYMTLMAIPFLFFIYNVFIGVGR